jgi:hypothetical protein
VLTVKNVVPLTIDATLFKRLQEYAIPLVDTPDSVLKRIFDHYDATAPVKTKTVTLSIEKPEPTHFKTSRGTVLPIGLKLFASYKAETPNAVVTTNGIEFNGRTYDDPSSAATAAKLLYGASQTAASTNGWEFWQYKDANGDIASIDAFRKPVH